MSRCSYNPDKFQVGNIIAFVLNVLVTYLGGVATVFGGKSNGDIADKYRTIASPSGYAFTIWSLIFIGEGIFTVWQALPARTGSELTHKTIGYWWMAACIAQCCWTPSFAHEVIWLAFVFLALISCCLGVIYANLDSVRSSLRAEELESTEEAERLRIITWWVVAFPFSIHFAWTLAATVVNLNLGIVWSHASVTAQYWLGMSSLSMLAVAVAVLSWYPRQDPVATFVGAWALAAIGSKLYSSNGRMRQDDKEAEFNTDSLKSCGTALFVLASVLALAGVVLVVLAGWRWGRRRMVRSSTMNGSKVERCELHTGDKMSDEMDMIHPSQQSTAIVSVP